MDKEEGDGASCKGECERQRKLANPEKLWVLVKVASENGSLAKRALSVSTGVGDDALAPM